MSASTDWKTVAAIASSIVAIFGLAWTYFGAVLNIKERIVALETKMELFWKPLQNFLTEAIHHPVTPNIDEKLERFDDLTLDELYVLKAEIKQDFDELVATGEKGSVKALYYTLLLSRIDLRAHDKIKQMCKSMSILARVGRALLGRT